MKDLRDPHTYGTWLPADQTTLGTTQGQMDGFFSQLPYKRRQNRVASVGDGFKICPWVASRVDAGVGYSDDAPCRNACKRFIVV